MTLIKAKRPIKMSRNANPSFKLEFNIEPIEVPNGVAEYLTKTNDNIEIVKTNKKVKKK